MTARDTDPRDIADGSVLLWRLPGQRLASLSGRELGVAEASVVLMASFLASAVLGAVQQVLFNAQFGAGREASAYYAALRLPDLLFSLIAGRALLSAFVPCLVEAARGGSADAVWRLTNLVLTTLVAVFAGVVLLCEVLAPAFVTSVLAPGFDAETSALTADLTRIMLLQPLILAVGTVMTAVLNSRRAFVRAAVSYASQNLAVIAGILAARIHPEIGIYGPAIGFVGSAVLQVAILLPGMAGRGYRFRLAWNLGDRRLRDVVRMLVPNGLAAGVAYAGFVVDTAFASQAPETAGLAALFNAWLLVGLPVSLLGKAVAQSALPSLAGQVVADEWPHMRRTLVRTLLVVGLLAVVTLLAMLVLGRPTIRLLFERGRYDAEAGTLTYQVLRVYALALPAYVATEVVTRALIALRDTRTPLVVAAARLVGRALVMALLVGHVGVLAVPIAFALTAVLEAVALAGVFFATVERRIRLGSAGLSRGAAT